MSVHKIGIKEKLRLLNKCKNGNVSFKKQAIEKIELLPEEDLMNIIFSFGLYKGYTDMEEAIKITREYPNTITIANSSKEYDDFISFLYQKDYVWDDKKIDYNHFGAGKTVFELEDLCLQDGCIIRAGNIDDYNLGFGYNAIILSEKKYKTT